MLSQGVVWSLHAYVQSHHPSQARHNGSRSNNPHGSITTLPNSSPHLEPTGKKPRQDHCRCRAIIDGGLKGRYTWGNHLGQIVRETRPCCSKCKALDRQNGTQFRVARQRMKNQTARKHQPSYAQEQKTQMRQNVFIAQSNNAVKHLSSSIWTSRTSSASRANEQRT